MLYFDGKSYSLSMYAAGVAVEAMLRAFRGVRGLPFDDRHDLQKLFAESGILSIDSNDIDPDELGRFQRELLAKLNDVHLLWANDYRYASENRLRSHLRGMKAFRIGIRGDILKALAKRLFGLPSLCEPR